MSRCNWWQCHGNLLPPYKNLVNQFRLQNTPNYKRSKYHENHCCMETSNFQRSKEDKHNTRMPSTLPKHTNAKAQYVIKLNTPELWGYPLPTDIHTQPKRNWPINANTKHLALTAVQRQASS